MIKFTIRSLKNLHEILTSGLTLTEIERLVTVDAPNMYEYYMRGSNAPVKGGRLKKFLIFLKNLFFAFLLKLSPARRLVYVISLIFVGLAWWKTDWHFALYAFIIANFLIALELADKLITRDELAVAREIQRSLLPLQSNAPPGYETAFFCDPARIVGGDYYDFIPLPDGRLLGVVGDVSGKGISAALYMVKVQTMLHIYAQFNQNLTEIVARLNDYLFDQLHRNYFLTMTLFCIRPDGRIELCRAGHTPILFYSNLQRSYQILQPKGIGLGIIPSNNHKKNGAPYTLQNKDFTQLLETHQQDLQIGDTLFFYTDGLTEAFNAHQEEYGEERLLELLNRYQNAPPETMKSVILRELSDFRGRAEPNDDTTFVVLQRQA